jgi:hypothetical protein
MFLSAEQKNVSDIKREDLEDRNLDEADWDNLWVKVGAGFDVNFSDALFLKVEALWGFKFDNESEKETVKSADKSGYTFSYFHHGPTIKLALGYRIGM